MSAVTIDLGVVDDWEAVDDAALGLPRGWGLFGVLLLVLSLVSAVPLPERPRELIRQPLHNGAFHLVQRTLFVLDSNRTPTPVEAFDPTGGRLRWNFTPEGFANLSRVYLRGDLAVFSPDTCRTGTTGTTIAVDTAGGRERWRTVGVPVRTPPGAGTVVMRSLWSDGCRAIVYNNPIVGVLRWLSIGPAGEVLWDTPVEAGTRVAVDTAPAGAGWAALVEPDGRVSGVDLRTGVRSTAGAVPTVQVDETVAVVGDLLLVMRWDPAGGQTRIRAYTRDLRPAWSAEAATGPGGPLTAEPCGDGVCVTGRSTAALDPVTGALLWLRPASFLGSAAAAPGYNPPPGWRVLGGDGQRVLLGLPTGDDTMLAWSTETAPFATVDGTLERCDVDGALLGCATGDDEVVVLKMGLHKGPSSS